jgi:hypothetical protein
VRSNDLAAAMEGLAAALRGKPASVVGGVSPPEDVVAAADRIVRALDLKGVRYSVRDNAAYFEPDETAQ